MLIISVIVNIDRDLSKGKIKEKHTDDSEAGRGTRPQSTCMLPLNQGHGYPDIITLTELPLWGAIRRSTCLKKKVNNGVWYFLDYAEDI